MILSGFADDPLWKVACCIGARESAGHYHIHPRNRDKCKLRSIRLPVEGQRGNAARSRHEALHRRHNSRVPSPPRPRSAIRENAEGDYGNMEDGRCSQNLSFRVPPCTIR
ncbi:hypothetical protein PMAYCL1PPCAC_24166 [Pristionchus mayeri]|uniref:Uncharacterized protein n=1 Tax=Pristionchus mayeri TaxID=1317129 RepID=A0AAN5I896_9BILA|nr:hypothetical protein PMAYCL1PPCAC_24166 [Pristionchus mayeri]